MLLVLVSTSTILLVRSPAKCAAALSLSVAAIDVVGIVVVALLVGIVVVASSTLIIVPLIIQGTSLTAGKLLLLTAIVSTREWLIVVASVGLLLSIEVLVPASVSLVGIGLPDSLRPLVDLLLRNIKSAK